MKKISLTLIIIFISISVFAQSKKPVTPKSVTGKAAAVSPASIAKGKVVYNTYCVACHQPDGGGVPSMNAPIVKTSYVLGAKIPLINILLKGMQDVEIDGETYSNVMPSHSFLTNQQIADVLTYIRNNFGNKASAVTTSEVAAVRNKK